MNRPQAIALARDAFYQVLDNWVFRIVLALTLLPVAAAFLIGFREDEIVLGFGLKRWSYAGILELVPGGSKAAAAGFQGARELVLDQFVEVVVTGLAGSFGLLIALAATSFFVPRMLEKGAADILFHKPLSRLQFFLTRYAAGLLFVGVQACVLVGGMYVGFALVSGYSNPGMLLSAPLMLYVFALVYPVSMLVGVVTRSTVGAILVSGIFYAFNGCIHQIWISRQNALAGAAEPPLSAASDDEDAELAAAEENGSFAWFWSAMDVLHFSLPRTSDADYLAADLRALVDGPAWADPDTRWVVERIVEPAQQVAPSELVAQPLSAESTALLFGEARFALRSSVGSLSIWRRPLRTLERSVGGKLKPTRERERDAQAALVAALEARGVSELASGDFERENPTLPPGALPAQFDHRFVAWTPSDGTRARAWITRRGEWLVTLWLSAPDAAALDLWRDQLEQVTVEQAGPDSGRRDWYGRKLSFSGPWRFHYGVSFASSLFFAALVLALGWWRLERMEL